MQVEKVLWITDMSEAAQASFATAAHWAHAFGAELHLLHVATPGTGRSEDESLPDEASLRQALEQQSGPLLQELENTAPESRPPHLHYEIRFAATASPAILEYVDEAGIDLIVLSTHGLSGLGRFFLGSTADALLRGSRCPILTQRRHLDQPAGDKRILVPIDLSQSSHQSLQAAATISAWTGATVDVLHVVEAMGDWDGNFGSIRTWPTVEEIRQHARARAQELIEPLAIDPDLVEISIATGFISESILDHATETHPSLIIQASHAGGIGRRLLGSTAERILHRSQIPVLTLPPAREQPPL
jgi:nucleotide-binding universal stress UspA family protein